MPYIDELFSTPFVNNHLTATVIALCKERALYYRDVHHLEEIVVHTFHIHDVEGISIITRLLHHVSASAVSIERNMISGTALLDIRHSLDFGKTLVALVAIDAIYRDDGNIIIIVTRIDAKHQLILTVDDVEQTEQQSRDSKLYAQQRQFPAVAILVITTEGTCHRYLVV